MRTSGKWIVFVLFLSALAGCGKEKFSVPDQQTAFLTYLKNNKLDTTETNGVYRAYLDPPAQPDELPRPDRKARLTAEAPGLIDTGKLVVELGEKIAGNPLADAPTVESLRDWSESLKQIATRLNGKITRMGDLGPALEFSLLNLDVCVDSLTALGTRISARAEALREDRDALRTIAGNAAYWGGLMQGVGDVMTEVAAWPVPGRIAPGDEVALYYSGHIFDRSKGLGNRFTSNAVPMHNLTGAEEFPLLPEPTRIRVGDGALVRGIDLGLQGTFEQNCFRLFLSADLAYGERYIGIVPSGSPVVFNIDIREVIKP
jgi:hypothetical protein